MYFKQGDVFWGTSMLFIKEMMKNTEKVSFAAGEILFKEGDPAEYFYMLLKGRIRLKIGRNDESVYVVNNAGEAFGWSSLVGMDAYSASAECSEAAVLIKIHRENLQPLLDNYTADGLLVYKRLAATLGRRLLRSYRAGTIGSDVADSVSYGTGQVQDLATA